MRAGRRHDHETVEEKTAKALAKGLGYGDAWPMPPNDPEFFPEARGDDYDAGDDDAGDEDHDVLYFTYEAETVEQAGQALPTDQSQWSEQLRLLPAEKRAEIAAWSQAHPLQEKRGQIGEHERWRKFPIWTVPRAAQFRDCALAFSLARLTAIEHDMLLTYGVMDWRGAERVLLFARDRGHNSDVAANALQYRILFPHARMLHHNVKDRARALHMRVIAYVDAEQRAADMLRELLHTASAKFWDAYTLDDIPAASRSVSGAREHLPTTISIGGKVSAHTQLLARRARNPGFAFRTLRIRAPRRRAGANRKAETP